MTKEELKPIDTSKYKITETGLVLKMTVEELEKATGKELIEERDYCGVDGYRGNYLDEVNAEMLKRFNRFAELEKENAELREKLEVSEKLRDYWKSSSFDWRHKCTRRKSFKVAVKAQKQLTKAKELIKEMLSILPKENIEVIYEITEEAEQFIKE